MKPAFDPEAYVTLMAAALNLPLREPWHDATIANMAATQAAAALVLAFPLDDHVEPAPVFTA